MRTFTECSTALGLKPVGSFVFKKDCHFPKSGDTVPAGAEVTLHYSEKAGSRVYFSRGADFAKTIKFQNCHKYFAEFRKMPSMRTLEKQANNAVVTTPIGEKTEPDGYGPSGLPSWLLVLGVI
jgi:hypothetical protein